MAIEHLLVSAHSTACNMAGHKNIYSNSSEYEFQLILIIKCVTLEEIHAGGGGGGVILLFLFYNTASVTEVM
jgi:hypothetical protein